MGRVGTVVVAKSIECPCYPFGCDSSSSKFLFKAQGKIVGQVHEWMIGTIGQFIAETSGSRNGNLSCSS